MMKKNQVSVTSETDFLWSIFFLSMVKSETKSLGRFTYGNVWDRGLLQE